MSHERIPGVPAQPTELGPRGHRLCRGCHQEIDWHGKNAAWCSDSCRKDTSIRAGWHVRHYVHERDKGVCTTCGADADKAERILRRLLSWYRVALDYGTGREAATVIATAWGRDRFNLNMSLWEADHVVPVIEGGGGCGLDGYRTLCRPCHLAETALLARRRADARRGQASLLRSEA